MARRRLTRTLHLILMVALLFLVSMAVAPHAALAHGAGPSLHKFTFEVDGKVYTSTQGETIEVPTTLPDGSQGYIFASSGEIVHAATTNGDPCTTNWDRISMRFWSYTLFSYFCWDGTYVTYFGQPYAQWNSSAGWSMDAHLEEIDNQNQFQVVNEGLFRFNGPFGIGCKSGFVIDYDDYYGVGPDTAGLNSQFGC